MLVEPRRDLPSSVQPQAEQTVRTDFLSRSARCIYL